MLVGESYSESSVRSWAKYVLLNRETGEMIDITRGAVPIRGYADIGDSCGNSILIEGIESPYYLLASASANISMPTNEFRLSVALQRMNYVLSTINNLSTPVTKTNTQSMKVTYEVTNS